MSDFEVHTDAIRQLANLLGRQAMATGGARYYINPVSQLSTGLGSFPESEHNQLIQNIQLWFYDLGYDACAQSETAVDDAADYYDRTNAEVEESFDERHFPDLDMTMARQEYDYSPVTPPASVSTFQDVADANERFHPFLDPQSFEEQDMSHMSWFEAFSISGWANEIITSATQVLHDLGLPVQPVNPIEELFRPLVGDWSAVRATAAGLRQLSVGLGDIQSNLNWAVQGLDSAWRGNAGDGAAVYLMSLVKTCGQMISLLDELPPIYDNAVEDMKETRDSLVNLFKTLVDTAVEIAAAAAISGGSAATGVGAPVAVVGAGYIIYKGYRLIDGIKDLFNFINNFNTTMSVFAGVVVDYSGIDASAPLPRLPGGPLEAPK